MKLPVGRLNDRDRLVVAFCDGRCHDLVACLQALGKLLVTSRHCAFGGMRFEQDAEAERLLNVGLAPFRYVNALAGVRRRESVLNQPSQGCPHRRAAKTQLSRQRFFPKVETGRIMPADNLNRRTL